MLIDSSLISVFLVGLLGGVHCATMCGGIVSVLGMQAARPAPIVRRVIPIAAVLSDGVEQTVPVESTGRSSAVVRLLAYNTGRIGMYSLSGGLVGAIGSTAWLFGAWLPIQQWAFVLTNLMLILMGLYLLGSTSFLRAVESLGGHVWRRVRPYATRMLTGTGNAHALAAGALWGLVPCGMVYGVLLAALASGGAANGASLMLAFGLGTLPNLMLLGLSGHWLNRIIRKRLVRTICGISIVVFGVLGLMRIEMIQNLPIIGDLCITPFSDTRANGDSAK